MSLIRAVFDAPKDCSNELLELEFRRHGQKFVEAMDKKGWLLTTPLDFHIDFGASRNDAVKNHYVITGDFRSVRHTEQGGVIELPDRIVQKLIKKHGDKVRVLS